MIGGKAWNGGLPAEPVMRRMSLNTPASVSTSPEPAPTRKTAATLRRKATAAFEMRMSGPRRRAS